MRYNSLQGTRQAFSQKVDQEGWVDREELMLTSCRGTLGSRDVAPNQSAISLKFPGEILGSEVGAESRHVQHAVGFSEGNIRMETRARVLTFGSNGCQRLPSSLEEVAKL